MKEFKPATLLADFPSNATTIALIIGTWTSIDSFLAYWFGYLMKTDGGRAEMVWRELGPIDSKIKLLMHLTMKYAADSQERDTLLELLRDAPSLSLRHQWYANAGYSRTVERTAELIASSGLPKLSGEREGYVPLTDEVLQKDLEMQTDMADRAYRFEIRDMPLIG
jgi:hypothetical protein